VVRIEQILSGVLIMLSEYLSDDSTLARSLLKYIVSWILVDQGNNQKGQEKERNCYCAKPNSRRIAPVAGHQSYSRVDAQH
jgi:hypothetical protein